MALDENGMMCGRWPMKPGTATHEIGDIHEEILDGSCERCEPRWQHVECWCGWVFHNKPTMPWLHITYADHLAENGGGD